MATGISKKNWNGVLEKEHFQKVGTPTEYQITYQGKEDDQVILSGKATQCRLFWKTPEVENAENSLFWGENLGILLSMLNNPEIHGKVKLIYIDPPYSTNSVFQSKASKDAYADLFVGSHYLEFMRERLIILRELLANDGSIYVHLDENMAFEIKIIMDEIFGKSNFKNWITRKKCSTKNTTKKRYGDVSDYILFYTKTNHYVWNRPFEEWPEEKIKKEYQCIDAKTGRRYKKVPIHAPGIRNGLTGSPWRGKLPPEGKHWQLTPDRLEELDEKGEIYWSESGNPRRKVFFDNSEGIPLQDIWLEYRDSINQNTLNTGYPTEKNLKMLETIIKASSNPGDLVLDCFCGSGTTLDAAYMNKRRWIGIDSGREAICCVLKRFHLGLESMGDYVNPKGTSNTTIELLDERYFKPSIFGHCDFDFYIEEKFWSEAELLFRSPTE